MLAKEQILEFVNGPFDPEDPFDQAREEEFIQSIKMMDLEALDELEEAIGLSLSEIEEMMEGPEDPAYHRAFHGICLLTQKIELFAEEGGEPGADIDKLETRARRFFSRPGIAPFVQAALVVKAESQDDLGAKARLLFIAVLAGLGWELG